jgi:hypothetical protein
LSERNELPDPRGAGVVNERNRAAETVRRGQGVVDERSRGAETVRRRDVWYWRLAIEVRNVVIVVVLGMLALAALVGVVILVTAIAVH